MLSMAREVVSKLEKQRVPEKWLAHAHGELDLASGRTKQGFNSSRMQSNYTRSHMMPTATWQPSHLRGLWIARVRRAAR